MAYVMTITASKPFKDGDETQGIAYVSVIMSVYVAFMFAGGCVQLIENDFKNPPQQDLENTVGEKQKAGSKAKKFKSVLNIKRSKKGSTLSTGTSEMDAEKSPKPADYDDSEFGATRLAVGLANPVLARTSALIPMATSNTIDSHNSLRPIESAGVRSIRQRLNARREDDAQTVDLNDDEDDDGDALDPVVSAVTAEINIEKHNVVLARFIIFLRNLYQPPTASLIVSIVVAVIDPVKALFVQTDYDMPSAPDGQPPLDFVMDFAEFIGNACVPFGLLLLGGMIGRLSIKSLPKGFWKYLVALILLKLVVTPIIAIAFTQGFRKSGLIDDDNLVLAFVFIMSSGVPSSTSQVYLTTFFAPEDMEHIPQMDCLAACLISQYIVLVLTLAILVTYTLQIIL